MSDESEKRLTVIYDSTMTLDDVASTLHSLAKQDKTRIVKRKTKQIPAYDQETVIFRMTHSLFYGVKVTVNCVVDRAGGLVLRMTQKPHVIDKKLDFNSLGSCDGY